MDRAVQVEQETDGRWIAEIPSLPGVMVYGATEADARKRVLNMAMAFDLDQRRNANVEDAANRGLEYRRILTEIGELVRRVLE